MNYSITNNAGTFIKKMNFFFAFDYINLLIVLDYVQVKFNIVEASCCNEIYVLQFYSIKSCETGTVFNMQIFMVIYTSEMSISPQPSVNSSQKSEDLASDVTPPQPIPKFRRGAPSAPVARNPALCIEENPGNL